MTNADNAQTPFRYATFRGTISEFLIYLGSHAGASGFTDLADPAEYEWELTASISRHPAGKGLLSEADAIRRERWSES